MTMSQKFGILSIILQIESPIKQRHLSSDQLLLHTSNQFVNILSSGKMHIFPANFNCASLITQNLSLFHDSCRQHQPLKGFAKIPGRMFQKQLKFKECQ
jgi:hypothetical protein